MSTDNVIPIRSPAGSYTRSDSAPDRNLLWALSGRREDGSIAVTVCEGQRMATAAMSARDARELAQAILATDPGAA